MNTITAMIVTDPFFYLAAVPAVLIYGIGKGGLGGALGVVAVPMMSLSLPVQQAAAILLPSLLVMDIFAVKHHYRFSGFRKYSYVSHSDAASTS
ncbi:hypothetical protein A8L45_06030 [Veronia pacifica]|uniref:Uncharacterized protein n=1 Tax=Veronia pacifica TaxID=1080227 RepID=A0A1C3EMR3_9GAMM|nr:hypothetical protein A8L45_06030 [Veronia pacifica]